MVGHRLGKISRQVQEIELKKRIVFDTNCQRCGVWIVCGVEVSRKDEMTAERLDEFYAKTLALAGEAIRVESMKGSLPEWAQARWEWLVIQRAKHLGWRPS